MSRGASRVHSRTVVVLVDDLHTLVGMPATPLCPLPGRPRGSGPPFTASVDPPDPPVHRGVGRAVLGSPPRPVARRPPNRHRGVPFVGVFPATPHGPRAYSPLARLERTVSMTQAFASAHRSGALHPSSQASRSCL
jgi:hypothetical protein